MTGQLNKLKPARANKPLFEGAEWDFETLQRVYDAIEDIALNDLGLSVYPNQIEIISSEQMLDAYSSHGMPLMYNHWSFGKIFAREETIYSKGWGGLAYEIVINSNPCINFLMEENTMTMQTLVMAHAGFGHNHFFKNNYLFKQWTDAAAILDYLNFAKRYIAKCEEEYGFDVVEAIVDSAHALARQRLISQRAISQARSPKARSHCPGGMQTCVIGRPGVRRISASGNDMAIHRRQRAGANGTVLANRPRRLPWQSALPSHPS